MEDSEVMGPGDVVAVIVAGGIGKRLKSRCHKPFVQLGTKPMLAWTLEAFEKTPSVGGVVVVVHSSDIESARQLIRSCGCRKIVKVVSGGTTRMASVACGLKNLPLYAKWIAVHDGARPLVTPELIEATVREGRRAKAAIAAVPVVPTVKQVSAGWVEKTLDRNRLWAVQTPQVFERGLLERAHAKGKARGMKVTDDAALVEAMGHRVRIVPGDHRNLKVTTPEDLFVAKAFLRRKIE